MESITRFRMTSRASQVQPGGQQRIRTKTKVTYPTSRPGPLSCEEERQRWCLLTYDEMPEWYKDNEHIKTSYRPVSGSARRSFASWTYLHNETINIFSHMLPAIAFFLGGWYMVSHLHDAYKHLTSANYWIFSIFLVTAVSCLSFSTLFHTLGNHSHEVASIWLRMDYVGIVLLTLGDFVSGIYMVFWCEPLERKIYWPMIGTLGAVLIFIMLSPPFQGPKWRTFRVLTFVVTGLSGFVPLAHGIYLFGASQMMEQSGMPYYLVEGCFFVLGATVYTTRFPERLAPGRFDIYGSSHQIFHVLVVLAIVTQLVGILSAFDYNYHNRNCKANG